MEHDSKVCIRCIYDIVVSWRSNRKRSALVYIYIYYIYTIKTRLMCIYMCIYMFICSELIEENGRPPGLIFGMWGYFWPGSDKFESWKVFHTFDGVMT